MSDEILQRAIAAIAAHVLSDKDFAFAVQTATQNAIASATFLTQREKAVCRGTPTDQLITRIAVAVALLRASRPEPVRPMSAGQRLAQVAAAKLVAYARIDQNFAAELKATPSIAVGKAPRVTDEESALLKGMTADDLAELVAIAESTTPINPLGQGAQSSASSGPWFPPSVTSVVLVSTEWLQQLTGDIDVAMTDTDHNPWNFEAPHWNTYQPGWYLPAFVGTPTPAPRAVPAPPFYGDSSLSPLGAENQVPGLTCWNRLVDGCDGHWAFSGKVWDAGVPGTTPKDALIWLMSDCWGPLNTGGQFPDTIGFSEYSPPDAARGKLFIDFHTRTTANHNYADHRPNRYPSYTVVVDPQNPANWDLAALDEGHFTVGADTTPIPLGIAAMGPTNSPVSGISSGAFPTPSGAGTPPVTKHNAPGAPPGNIWKYVQIRLGPDKGTQYSILTYFDEDPNSTTYQAFRYLRWLSATPYDDPPKVGTRFANTSMHHYVSDATTDDNLPPGKYICMFGHGNQGTFLCMTPEADFGTSECPVDDLGNYNPNNPTLYLTNPAPGFPFPHWQNNMLGALTNIGGDWGPAANISAAEIYHPVGLWFVLTDMKPDQPVDSPISLRWCQGGPFGHSSAPIVLFRAENTGPPNVTLDPTQWTVGAPRPFINNGDTTTGLTGPGEIGQSGTAYMPRIIESLTTRVYGFDAYGIINSITITIYWTLSTWMPMYSHLMKSTLLVTLKVWDPPAPPP